MGSYCFCCFGDFPESEMKSTPKPLKKPSNGQVSTRIQEPATKPVKTTKAAIRKAVRTTIRKQVSASAR
jgi:hypothetical protein